MKRIFLSCLAAAILLVTSGAALDAETALEQAKEAMKKASELKKRQVDDRVEVLIKGDRAESRQPGPGSFDISGFKLGRPGGPALKKEIEAKGYKCLDVEEIENISSISEDYEVKLLGYSCFSPQAPDSPYIEGSKQKGIYPGVITSHLLFLLDEDSGQVWYIMKRERFPDEKQAPTMKSAYDAFVEKYGAYGVGSNYYESAEYKFDGKGQYTTYGGYTAYGSNFATMSSEHDPSVKSGGEHYDGSKNTFLWRLDIPMKFSSDHGIILRYGADGTIKPGQNLTSSKPLGPSLCKAYTLELYDSRAHVYRQQKAEAKQRADIEQRHKAVTPTF
jgi:hypothetical protein